MKNCGIYCVTHVESGKRYIGKSCRIRARWNEHVRECRNYDNRFYNALTKYGKEAFEWEIIEECEIPDLNQREMFWIAHYDSMNSGFNLTPGGDGILAGFKHSAAERAAKSLRQKGKPHSAEHSRKVGDALRGRIPSDEELKHLRALALSQRGKSNILSERGRQNIVDAAKARIGRKQPTGSHTKQWETRRAKYGKSGFTGDGFKRLHLRGIV